MIQLNLPVEERSKMKILALKNFSISYAKRAYWHFRDEHDKEFADKYLSSALKIQVNFFTIYWTIKYYMLYVFKPIHTLKKRKKKKLLKMQHEMH